MQGLFFAFAEIISEFFVMVCDKYHNKIFHFTNLIKNEKMISAMLSKTSSAKKTKIKNKLAKIDKIICSPFLKF